MMERPYPLSVVVPLKPEFVAMAIWLTVQTSPQRCGSCRSTNRADQNADFRLWHKADITIALNHVRFWGKADIALISDNVRF